MELELFLISAKGIKNLSLSCLSCFSSTPSSPSENGRLGVYHRGQNRYHDST